MKVYIDIEMIKAISDHPVDALKSLLIADHHQELVLGWPSLFEYLGLGALFNDLSIFDQTQLIFKTYLSTLSANQEKEALFYLYDSLFVECLTQIKSLPQVNAQFLLDAIATKRHNPCLSEVEKLLDSTLIAYEAAISNEASDTMHGLILYLAWDRMCVYLSRLFDHQSTDPNLIKSLEVFKNCLIESYQHIAHEGRTNPSFYRLSEALVFYYMREENLKSHQDLEWTTLIKSFSVIKAQNDIVDFPYVDNAVVSRDQKIEENTDCYLTQDSLENVNTRLAFVNTVMDRLKSEFPEWGYMLQKKKIIHI